jgi:MurNAc alpha-1-phosphate uridylyltransferase
MKAMILAAGKGTRLSPLTEIIPKALIRAGGKPLLGHAIDTLYHAGCHDIIINVHYHADQVIHFLEHYELPGLHVEISREDELLDTGGGLKKASWFFSGDDDFIVFNADVVTDLDLAELIATHKKSEALATLAVRKRSSSRQLLFDRNMNLKGWIDHTHHRTLQSGPRNTLTREFAFSGIHVIHPSLFQFMDETGTFPIIPVYVRLSAKHRIRGYRHDHSTWFDVGKSYDLAAAEKWLAAKKKK